MWASRLYDHYQKNLCTLFNKVPGLTQNFEKTIWASSAFNLSPQTVCRIHRDSKDLLYSLCAVTALGDFDYKTGSHLVLDKMKLAIQFSPGSTILLPSATVAHGNSAISEGERQYLFTQYTSRSLFHWVENGFITVAEYEKRLQAAAMEEEQARIRERLLHGAEFYFSLEELQAI